LWDRASDRSSVDHSKLRIADYDRREDSISRDKEKLYDGGA